MLDVTVILNAVEQGDASASARLLPLVYQELRHLARRQMGQERIGHTLDATALVHEAYLRLVGDNAPHWDSRAHFFAVASEAMRRILIEHARRRRALRNGGGRDRVSLTDDEVCLSVFSRPRTLDELLDLNDALDRRARYDPEKAQLVTHVYFAGLTLEDAAHAMGISRATAYRHWTFARAWLRDAIGGERPDVAADRSVDQSQ